MKPTESDRSGSVAYSTAPGAAISDRPSETQSPQDPSPPDPYHVRAKHLLKARALWMIPVIVGSILLVLMTIFYVGSVVNPVGHLHGLPVSIVNEDSGASVGERHVDLGAQLQSGLTSSRAVSRLLALTPERLAAAESRMNHDGAYATLVIPPNFTASLLSLSGVRLQAAAPVGKPSVEFLANRRAGTVGVQLADGVLEPAIGQASHRIGDQLLTAARPTPATGYATTEIGPKWSQRAPLPINRWQTLLTKWTMALPVTALLTGLMLAVAIGLLGMNAPNAVYLWLFTWLAAASVAAGTLVLFAVLGTQGQLIALLLFVYLGLASAGGTVPLQALPDP